MTLKTLTLTLALAGAGFLAGCSSPSVVTKTDGSQMVTSEKPDFDEETGTYQYEDNGRKVQMNKDQIDRIEEVED